MDVTMILLPLCVQATWYCPPPPVQTDVCVGSLRLFGSKRHGFVAVRLSPSRVIESFAPASATVRALLHSSDLLD